ncbi:MAG TPA: transposase [Terriglobales bacterium]|nr:transposase [Terriglobales bacterium]
MALGKRYSPHEAKALLEKVEREVALGTTLQQSCREAGIAQETFRRWRREIGGQNGDGVRRIKELESENAKLKRLIVKLTLEKQGLHEIVATLL